MMMFDIYYVFMCTNIISCSVVAAECSSSTMFFATVFHTQKTSLYYILIVC